MNYHSDPENTSVLAESIFSQFSVLVSVVFKLLYRKWTNSISMEYSDLYQSDFN